VPEILADFEIASLIQASSDCPNSKQRLKAIRDLDDLRINKLRTSRVIGRQVNNTADDNRRREKTIRKVNFKWTRGIEIGRYIYNVDKHYLFTQKKL